MCYTFINKCSYPSCEREQKLRPTQRCSRFKGTKEYCKSIEEIAVSFRMRQPCKRCPEAHRRRRLNKQGPDQAGSNKARSFTGGGSSNNSNQGSQPGSRASSTHSQSRHRIIVDNEKVKSSTWGGPSNNSNQGSRAGSRAGSTHSLSRHSIKSDKPGSVSSSQELDMASSMGSITLDPKSQKLDEIMAGRKPTDPSLEPSEWAEWRADPRIFQDKMPSDVREPRYQKALKTHKTKSVPLPYESFDRYQKRQLGDKSKPADESVRENIHVEFVAWRMMDPALYPTEDSYYQEWKADPKEHMAKYGYRNSSKDGTKEPVKCQRTNDTDKQETTKKPVRYS